MGGNVFRDPTGRSLTQRIDQTDIPSTIQWLEDLTGINFPRETWLGSTGKKSSSGDIDLAVDANLVSKDKLADELLAWIKQHTQKTHEWISKKGELHLRTPIGGDPQKGFAQVDFMFFPNMDWGTFYYGCPEEETNYTGKDRNVLLSSLAKPLGLKVGSNGVISRNSNSVVSTDPKQAAEWLLGKGRTVEDLESVESIYKAVAKDKDSDEKLKDFREYLQKEGLSEPTALQEDSDVNFLARLRDRIVNQGMVPIMEDEAVVNGGKAKGIEHLEDLVFRKGSTGIKQALDTLKHLEHHTPESATVKWDGSPGIVFGRLPDGQFVLTDISGFNATGYNGLFTELNSILEQLDSRDRNARVKGKLANRLDNLSPIYSKLWPVLEQATPKGFRGFVHGDLLYSNTPLEESGALVFKPNTIEYKIPVNSDLGKSIQNSDIGIAMHTFYPGVGEPKEIIGDSIKFKPVDRLNLISPVAPTENVRVTDRDQLKELRQLYKMVGNHIDTLFNPNELRAQRITDLPKLCIDYVNHLVKDDSVEDFDPYEMSVNFIEWLKTKVRPSKFANILEYLDSPKTNATALESAFVIFGILHEMKTDLLQQLDRQCPGQEGWVIATPHGHTKFVNRFGFTRENAKKQKF